MIERNFDSIEVENETIDSLTLLARTSLAVVIVKRNMMIRITLIEVRPNLFSDSCVEEDKVVNLVCCSAYVADEISIDAAELYSSERWRNTQYKQ